MPVWTLKCRFLSAGFGALSAGLPEKRKNFEEKNINISRKASPSCALNNTNVYRSWLDLNYTMHPLKQSPFRTEKGLPIVLWPLLIQVPVRRLNGSIFGHCAPLKTLTSLK